VRPINAQSTIVMKRTVIAMLIEQGWTDALRALHPDEP
jgi:exonuclease III